MRERYEVEVLGPEPCRIPGTKLSPAVADTLALLVAAGPQGASREQLADQFWPNQLDPDWAKKLNKKVSRVRARGLEVANESGRYRLVLGVQEVDAWHLEQLVERVSVEGIEMLQVSELRAVTELTIEGPLFVDALDSTMIDDARLRLRGFREQARLLLIKESDAVPARLARLHRSDAVGRSTILEAVDGALTAAEEQPATPVVVVEAARGLGRTTVLAEVAHRWAGRAHLVELLGAPSENLVVAPLTRLAPDLEVVLRRPTNDTNTGELADLARWDTDAVARQIVDRLRDQSAGNDLLVLIDDAHLFDGDAAAIVAQSLMVLAQPDGELTPGRRGFRGVILTTRSPHDTDASAVPPWRRHLDTARELRGIDRSFTWLALAPLTEAEMERLVERDAPELVGSTRRGVVRWLLRASAGIPDVAQHLLACVRSGQEPSGLDRYDHALAMLDRETLDLGAHAAVLGRRFTIETLAELTSRDATGFDGALDLLVTEGLVRLDRTGTTGVEVEFIDDAIVATFADRLNRGRRARLHARALELVNDEPVAEARHRLSAGSLIDAAKTATAVLAAVAILAEDNRWWESRVLLETDAAAAHLIDRLSREHDAHGSDLAHRLERARAQIGERTEAD